MSDRPTSRLEPFAPATHLFVVMNCAAPLEPASRHCLEGLNEVEVGRRPERSTTRHVENGRRVLRLWLADARVSSAHARLTRRGEEWHLQDLGSKNGTKVNGLQLGQVLLSDGDHVQIGRTILIFRAALPTPAGSPHDLSAEGRFPAFATLLPAFAHELDALARAAASRLPILLLSETGTGKELLAHTLHQLSGRTGRFVPINCAAIADSLAQSALFGHKKGSFSGAVADNPGLFREAHHGTVLLDEVGDMPPSTQSAVLRTLHDGEILPIGETLARHVDVRILAATNRDLQQLAADGRFREDLLARLSGLRFTLPPLRKRKEDLGLILRNLSTAGAEACACTFSPDVVALLLRHSWPHNIRELDKCVAYAVTMAQGRPIEPAHLPDTLRNGGAVPDASPQDRVRDSLVSLLDRHHGNVAAVAEAMRTSRSQVHRLMKRFEIQLARYRR